MKYLRIKIEINILCQSFKNQISKKLIFIKNIVQLIFLIKFILINHGLIQCEMKLIVPTQKNNSIF